LRKKLEKIAGTRYKKTSHSLNGPDKEKGSRNPTKAKKYRPSWEVYFLQIAKLTATRSTCLRRKVGALLIKDRNILATGYNGAPTGITHCEETGCIRERDKVPSGERHELCRGLHAEQNAIIQAAHHGVSIEGAELFCTNFPCIICSKMLINAGIRSIYYLDGYPDHLSEQMIKEAGLTIYKLRL
jgi:dCMP deaminase